jgi:zinc and cadmium transporter
VIAYVAVGWLPSLRAYVLAFSSASLMYIAMSDLIPDLHRGRLDSNSLRQVVLILAGVVTVVILETTLG